MTVMDIHGARHGPRNNGGQGLALRQTAPHDEPGQKGTVSAIGPSDNGE
jgi:hypothetical protein